MPYLIFRDQNTREKVYKLKFGINKIGRLLDNDIVFSDSSVSRHHAIIEVKPNQTIIQDLNSKNHTFVNEVEISQVILQEGDLISFGNVTLTYDSIYKPQVNLVENQQQPIIVKQINSQQNLQIFEALNKTQSSHYSLIKIASKKSEQRILEKLKILLEISKQLCSPEKPEQILNKVLDFLFKVMDVDRAVILLVNEKTKELELKAVKLAYGLDNSGQFYSSKITNLARETGDTILTANAMTDERFKNSKSIVSSSVHASICVPLKTNDRIIGVLYADNLFMPSVYDDEDVEFLACLANQAAAAIHMVNEFDKREQELKRQINEFITVFKN
ncbi:FHA domain containing protein [Stanieria cyanosphaera PCC 7437]|uniref:FHA domain containing protein n=1 Tax=Stanieria cyanosphaera (strain ATCC 29371 / PCC 7437) TaxID=111780 RepID=K9XW62_STAC7|nr:FHA domain-containing protein [Stanieria cyanosphaera]AFZ35907.1 FHA domain containing protein [Stanieria cyanosphaera PCC 7437]